MSFAIRVGLGIGSDFVNPQDLLDAKAQLNSQIVSVGKRTLLKRNDAPEVWPSHLTFNLDERGKSLLARHLCGNTNFRSLYGSIWLLQSYWKEWFFS